MSPAPFNMMVLAVVDPKSTPIAYVIIANLLRRRGARPQAVLAK
jgi:hypothetical protein